MKFNRFIQTIPLAAVAMQTNQVNLSATIWAKEAQVAQPIASIPVSIHSAVTESAAMVDPGSVKAVRETVHRVMQKPPGSWSEVAKRYDQLVTKEAVGSISLKETAELDRLQKLRRKIESPPSGNEVLARYRREKLDQEMLNILKRHVRVEELRKNPS